MTTSTGTTEDNFKSSCKSGIALSTKEELDCWTEERIIDELFLQLAETKMIIQNSDKSIAVRKYYHQALALRRWIPIAEPAPEFVVNLSDLNARIILELKTLGDPYYVLRQAVGRIFENTDFRQYHLSVARKLKVRLSK
jgi:hypothetical protein